MAINKKKIPEVNAGSMADISFLLLIFFLVATTMNVDSGIQRMLPPMVENPDDIKINQRNLMLIFVNKYQQISVGNEVLGTEVVDISQLKDRVKTFILNPTDNEKMPEKEEKQIDLIGNYPVSKGVVSLQSAEDTHYEIYIHVQNEITRAYNELRDELSNERFGRNFSDLSEDYKKALLQAIPTSLSEAEPRVNTR